MRIKTTVKHDISFCVYSCWPEEGGMGEESFGSSVGTLEEAITIIDIARISRTDCDWFIRCDVTKVVVLGDGKPEAAR